MTRSALTALGFAAALSVLSACSFGPDGKPPVMPAVAHYGADAQPVRTVTAEGVSQSFDAGAKPVPEWWKLYRSEPLNALVDEGLRNSPSLAAPNRSNVYCARIWPTKRL
jgi:outer membrane protein TolC